MLADRLTEFETNSISLPIAAGARNSGDKIKMIIFSGLKPDQSVPILLLRLIFGVAISVLAGCTGGDQHPGASEPNRAASSGSLRDVAQAKDRPSLEPLRIAAATDLQAALPKLADRFQARTGVTTSLIFGASGQLAQQIKGGGSPQ